MALPSATETMRLRFSIEPCASSSAFPVNFIACSRRVTKPNLRGQIHLICELDLSERGGRSEPEGRRIDPCRSRSAPVMHATTVSVRPCRAGSPSSASARSPNVSADRPGAAPARPDRQRQTRAATDARGQFAGAARQALRSAHDDERP
jgi:hypothetical protein